MKISLKFTLNLLYDKVAYFSYDDLTLKTHTSVKS